MRSIELSRAGVNRARFDRVCDVVHRQSARSQRRRIGFDPNGALNSINAHLRNAGQDRDPLRHHGGGVLI